MKTPYSARITVRLNPEEAIALTKIAATITTPHRRAPTTSEAIRAAIQAAVAAIAITGTLAA